MTQPQAQPAPSARRFECLTGIRGLAILWVVFVHLPIEMWPWLERCKGTWGVGVDLFLAVSGFLVTRSLLQSDRAARAAGRSRGRASLDFLSRRVSRIFPSYFAFCALIAAIAVVVDRTLLDRMLAVPGLVPGLFLFFANYPMAAQYAQVPVIVSSIWSLALQEQFYLLLVGAYLLSRGRPAVLIALAGLGSIAARLYLALGPWSDGPYTASIQMLTHLRLDAIAWSALAWIHYDRVGQLWATPARRRAFDAALALAWLALLIVIPTTPGNGVQAVLYIPKGLMLALSVRRFCDLDASGGLFARLARSRPLQRIGVSAYEIYLVNPVVMAALVRLKLRSAWLEGALGMAVSVGAGWLAYELYGRPLQRRLRGWLLGEKRPVGAPAAESVGG